MTVDYDAPRRTQDDSQDDSLEGLAGPRNDSGTAVLDVDDLDMMDSYELPGADLSGEELLVRVVPKRADEFTCTSCFLVYHRSRLASATNGAMLCADCA
jgi:hypothetical protein